MQISVTQTGINYNQSFLSSVFYKKKDFEVLLYFYLQYDAIA
jgi:hypothetical protein